MEAKVSEVLGIFPDMDEGVIRQLLVDNNGAVQDVVECLLSNSAGKEGNGSAANTDQALSDAEIARMLQAEEDARTDTASAPSQPMSDEQYARMLQAQEDEAARREREADAEEPSAVDEITHALTELKTSATTAMTSLFSKVKEGVMTAKKALATDDEAEHGENGSATAGPGVRETVVPLYKYNDLPAESESPEARGTNPRAVGEK